MKLLKLTVFSLFISAFLFSISSCQKDDGNAGIYAKSDIPMTGAQSVPISNSTATGTLSVSYDKNSKILNYTITWAGLSGPPTNTSGIFGPAPAGYAALTSAGGLAPAYQTITVTGLTAAGTYSGSIVMDNVKFKEQDLLNNLYYVRLNTAAYPTGAIRGQIKFQ